MRKRIALLYNDNPGVVALASHLMLLAAIYQISDSIQVIGSGILRGYKDTRSIFFITFTAYWVLGLPSGYLLALTDMIVPRMRPAGFWCGFIIGLTSAAIADDAADAFSAAPAFQHHLTARCALTCLSRAAPAGFFVLRYNGALYIPLLPDTKDSLIASRQALIVLPTAPQWGYSRNQVEDFRMKKVLALVVAAAMGLSSVAFAADAASTTPSAAASHTTVHHKKHHKAAAKPAAEQKAQAAKKHHKAAAKPAAEQKAQAAKKHHKAAAKPAVAQKAQAAKKHHKTAAKPAVAQKAQAAKKHHKAAHHAAKPAVKPAA